MPPAELAATIARALFPEEEAGERVPRTYPLARFQEHAVSRARRVLARRGGVVVADDVGLGKTYIALALIEESVGRGEEIVIVVPAALRRTWARLLPKLERAPGRRIELTTHTRLSRGTHDGARLRRAGLVVVDEAHAFRNPATRRYRALAARGPGSALVLLTATPVNNAIADLYHLVRLFARDDAFADIGVPGLRSAFHHDGGMGPGEDALRVVREVVVRRARADVGPGAGAAPFPRRAPTEVIRYDDPRVPGLVAVIDALELTAYHPGVDALLRLGLLKRLESGAAALAASLRRLGRVLAACADAADRGRLLRPGDPAAAPGPGDGDAVQLLLEEVLLDAAPPGMDLRDLAASARRDAAAIASALACLRGPDPKLDGLRRRLAERPVGEKVVVFTEFRDTAANLWRTLAGRGGVGRVDGAGAWLGMRRSGRRAVVERFAPVSSGVGPPPARERVDLLIATDVLSEGLNLQDARVVVSYDLPWNPVRLLQRIGRVDRMGSLHDEIQPVLFVPGAGLDDVLRLTRRLRAKLSGIAATVGVAEVGELLTRLGGAGRAPHAVVGKSRDPLVELEAEQRDPWEALRARVRQQDARPSTRLPGGRAPGSSVPVGAGWPSEIRDTARWLVLARSGAAPATLVVTGDPRGPRHAGPEEARALLRLLDDGSLPVPRPADPDLRAGAAAAVRSAVAFLRRRSAVARAPASCNHRGAAARLAREIRDTLRELGSDPDSALVGRADAALRRLAEPLPAGVEASLRRAAAVPPPRSDRAPGSRLDHLLRAVERLLPGTSPEHHAGLPDADRIAILGALRIGPADAPNRPPPMVDEVGGRR